MPKATKQAVLSSFGVPAPFRTRKVVSDLAADLPMGSKVRDVKVSAQVPQGLKLAQELPESLARQRARFPMTSLFSGEANIAGARVPNPLEFLSPAQIRSVMRVGGI